MQLKQLQVLLLFISFHTIINEPIKIQNFDGITFKDGIELEYDYNPSNQSIQDDIGTYFFFRFSFVRVYLYIIDEFKEDGGHIISNNFYRFHPFRIKNRNARKFTFSLSCIDCGSVSMFFIDNSNEINLNLNQFYEKYIDTDIIEDIPPLPLIFNLEESFEENSLIIEMDKNYNESSIYDGEYIIEYCEINENECNFSHNESKLIFKKDKII